jgi:hypothetical protein
LARGSKKKKKKKKKNSHLAGAETQAREVTPGGVTAAGVETQA